MLELLRRQLIAKRVEQKALLKVLSFARNNFEPLLMLLKLTLVILRAKQNAADVTIHNRPSEGA